MSLIVEVYVGSHRNAEHRKLVASSVIHNISDLADISNYSGVVEEKSAPVLGISPFVKEVKIAGHQRHQSVWALVKKIAERALE